MPMRRPQRPTLELLTLIAMAWALMAGGLAILPALIGNLVEEPWPVVIAWGIVSLAWVPVEAVLRPRLGPLTRFFLTVPLWLSAALCGFWVRQTLGLP
jgi:hypothetical protein